MDWANQPNPFRFYEGAERTRLCPPDVDEPPRYDDIFDPSCLPAMPVNHANISQLLYFSVAISAWKQVRGSAPWSLRVNPSSGDLHPTETYLVLGPDALADAEPAIYHYNVYNHELERRALLPLSIWEALSEHLPPTAMLVGLTSIHWRESWKYGERAYRYCHHDLGHAIAALCYSAAFMRWSTRVIHAIRDNTLAMLLGILDQHGVEAEHPDALLALWPNTADTTSDHGEPHIDQRAFERVRHLSWQGRPNRLSRESLKWDAIDVVSDAIAQASPPILPEPYHAVEPPAFRQTPRNKTARAIIHQRRSAVAMDGQTTLGAAPFYDMLVRTMPGNAIPFGCLPWPPYVSLAIFVHRVIGLDPGLYVLIRDPGHEEPLRNSLSAEFDWVHPEQCPLDIPLMRLTDGDSRAASRTISCHQDIAADGVFTLGMLARLDHALATHGEAYYSRLYWETGVIGQTLYLEAEAAGIRSTGIGCYFDDAMHDILGIVDTAWQSLYHFTVGGPVDDERLQTLPPYSHLVGQKEKR